MTFEVYRSESARWRNVRPASSYGRRGPNILGFVCKDDNLRQWTLDAFAERVAEVPPQDIYTFEKTLVRDDAVLFRSDGRPLQVSLVDRGEVKVLSEEEIGNADFHSGVAAAIFKAGINNFGHLLIEMVPKLEYLSRLGISPLTVLLPRCDGSTWSRFEALIHEMYPGEFVFKPAGPLVLVEELIVPGPVTKHNRQKSALVLEFADRVLSWVGNPAPAGRSIYCSRKNFSNRRLTNEDEIEQVATDAGFEIVYPEAMSISDQARIFASASRIVGPLGAGLSNIVFASADAEILMIDPGLCDMFFYDLACLRKQQFNWLFSDRVDFTTAESLHKDYTVRPDSFREAIRSIWEGVPA